MSDGIRTKRVSWSASFEMAQRAIAQAFAIQGRLVLKYSDGQEIKMCSGKRNTELFF